MGKSKSTGSLAILVEQQRRRIEDAGAHLYLAFHNSNFPEEALIAAAQTLAELALGKLDQEAIERAASADDQVEEACALLSQAGAAAGSAATAARQSPDDDVTAPPLEAARDLLHGAWSALDCCSEERRRVTRSDPAPEPDRRAAA